MGDATATVGAPRLEDELLQLYAKQGPRVPLPVFLAALLVASLGAGRVPMGILAAWLLAVGCVLALRWAVIRRLPRLTRLSYRQRIGIVAVLSAMGGIVHGASVGFWPYFTVLERAVQSMFVLGLCAGAVATTNGCLPVFLAYLVPMLVPLAASWGYVLMGESGGAWHQGASGVMLVLLALYGGLLTVLARDTYRRFRESFETRQQQAELNRQLSAALEQAEAANRSKTRFLASASHDLRQPMHTLSLFAAALTMRPLDERSRHIAVQMNVAMQALSSQLDALLDVSKLDAGVVPVKTATFSLSQFVSRLADEFAPAARRKGLRFTHQCPADALCHTDPMLLERVVRNLLDNAIKYSAQGSVGLEVQRLGGRYALSVRDTGPGIPEAEHGRVFEEFYQLGNPERDRAQGLGLGLSIVKRLSELLQLDLTMHSTLGSGSEFTLQLPAALRQSESLAALPVPTSIDGVHILVVDDEEAVRLGMQTLLEGLGCRVSLATGTGDAAEGALSERPDIVLADFRLRGDDDGVATIARLRGLHPRLPALLVSGDTAPARLREAHAAGLRLLHKPVAVDVLSRAIREEVDRGRTQHHGAGP